MKIGKENCCFRKKNRRILKKTVVFENVVDDLKKNRRIDRFFCFPEKLSVGKNELLQSIVYNAWCKDDAIIYYKK
jgi:hypothetical protein